jgi:hypothetical protein
MKDCDHKRIVKKSDWTNGVTSKRLGHFLVHSGAVFDVSKDRKWITKKQLGRFGYPSQYEKSKCNLLLASK